MDSQLGFDTKIIEQEFSLLLEKSREVLNTQHDYLAAYDLAVQAKYLAETFLNNQLYAIESEMLRGLAYLGLDRMIGHDILNKLYIENRQKIKEDINLEIRLKKNFGIAKRYIGEYDEAITFFCEVFELIEQEVDEAEKNDLPKEEYLRWIIYILLQMGISLVFKSRQKYYPIIVQRSEKRFKQMNLRDVNKVRTELEKVKVITDVNNELLEAKKYVNEALRMAQQYLFKDLELACLLNYACILVESEEYSDALHILNKIKDEVYIVENLLGNVLNEIAIGYINTGKLEAGVDLLHRAWIWLSKRNDLDELSRNSYATALYYYKKGQLDMAYAFAELTYNRDYDISSLKLLYEITFFKYLEARRLGNESEYVFYRCEYERYREQIERRA